MRISTLFLAVVAMLCVGGAGLAQTTGIISAVAPPNVIPINVPDAPIEIDSVRLLTEDGESVVEVQISNVGDADVRRVETTLLIYDTSGVRIAAQADEMSPEDLPIQARGKCAS